MIGAGSARRLSVVAVTTFDRFIHLFAMPEFVLGVYGFDDGLNFKHMLDTLRNVEEETKTVITGICLFEPCSFRLKHYAKCAALKLNFPIRYTEDVKEFAAHPAHLCFDAKNPLVRANRMILKEVREALDLANEDMTRELYFWV